MGQAVLTTPHNLIFTVRLRAAATGSGGRPATGLPIALKHCIQAAGHVWCGCVHQRRDVAAGHLHNPNRFLRQRRRLPARVCVLRCQRWSVLATCQRKRCRGIDDGCFSGIGDGTCRLSSRVPWRVLQQRRALRRGHAMHDARSLQGIAHPMSMARFCFLQVAMHKYSRYKPRGHCGGLPRNGGPAAHRTHGRAPELCLHLVMPLVACGAFQLAWLPKQQRAAEWPRRPPVSCDCQQ